MATDAPPAPVDQAPCRQRPPGRDISAAVDAHLSRFVADQSDALRDLDAGLEPLAAAAAAAVLDGGKRLRPTFAHWGWRGVAGPDAPLPPVLPALAALEVLHAFALVHDDVMDASAQRRGRPSTHRAFTDLHRARGLRGDAGRFGESAAVLVGDLLLVWADQLIAAATLGGPRRAAARRCYDRMRVEVVAGQFLDVCGESATAWPVARALRTAQLKTASYTVTRPLLYGAALAGGPGAPLARAYTAYGDAVGVAFQLRDDLLGLYGDAAVTGKDVGDDLARAKPTVLLQTARALATPAQAAALERALAPPAGPPDPARVAALVRDTGAPERLEKMIDERIARAHGALAGAPVEPQARQALGAAAAAAAWRAA